MADEKTPVPPYGVFATFRNSLDRLAQGIPNQIDRSVFPGMAWNAQNQLLAALRFFGLIDDNGRPTDALHAVAVTDEGKRKAQLDKLVRGKYSVLFALDLMKTTPAELDQRVTEHYGVTGDTRLKAVRFFLTALAYLEIPISPLFSKARGSNGQPSAGRRRPSTRRTRPANQGPLDREQMSGDEQDGDSAERVVQLASGGTLTMAVSLDVLRLSAADRQFVFSLIDKLDDYERSAKK